MILEKIIESWHNFSFLLALFVFLGYIVLDALHAYYTIQVSRLDEWKSAVTAGTMQILFAFGIINYVHNFLYIFPIALGSTIGAFLIVRQQRKKKERV